MSSTFLKVESIARLATDVVDHGKWISFNVAVDDNRKKEDGTWENKAQFFHVKVAGKKIEYVKNHIGKGDVIYFEGKYDNSVYTTKSGETKYNNSVIVTWTINLVSKNGNAKKDADGRYLPPVVKTPEEAYKKQPKKVAKTEAEEIEEELEFEDEDFLSNLDDVI